MSIKEELNLSQENAGERSFKRGKVFQEEWMGNEGMTCAAEDGLQSV